MNIYPRVRRDVPFFRGDDQVCEHRKFRRAGLEATGLYWLCVSYSSRYLTDGRVDFDYITDRIPSKARRKKLVETLCDVGLFEPNGSGYIVHDYLDHNPSREEVLRRREHAAEKKRTQRMSRGDSTGDGHGDW